MYILGIFVGMITKNQ